MVRYAEPRDGSGEASVESVVDTPGGDDDHPRTALVQAVSDRRPGLAPRAQAGPARPDALRIWLAVVALAAVHHNTGHIVTDGEPAIRARRDARRTNGMVDAVDGVLVPPQYAISRVAGEGRKAGVVAVARVVPHAVI